MTTKRDKAPWSAGRMPELPDLWGTEETGEYVDPLWRRALRRTIPYELRVRARRFITETPGVSELFVRLDPRMVYTRVTAETRLVIDGFPRSANSYAHVAFLYANGTDFPLCSHRHSHQSIRSGVKRGLPTIVLIREPGPAIASTLQHTPDTRPATAIDLYRTFYEGVLPVLDRVLVVTFEAATGEFGDVIRRCNAKFGTDFVPYERTEEAEAAVARMIERTTAFAFGSDGHEQRVPRPSAHRAPADEIIAQLAPEERRSLDELDALYRHLVERRRG